jgi:hypothetical protein
MGTTYNLKIPMYGTAIVKINKNTIIFARLGYSWLIPA